MPARLPCRGYDPYPGFGWEDPPERTFDMVVQAFVLNVLPDPWQRLKALRDAAQFLRSGGWMLVVTRSSADIEARAVTAGWQAHHDGYWSSQARATFQKGISTEEVISLAQHVGMIPANEQDLLTPTAGACQILLTKPR
jgi:ubiquinone/menaquinone biosynthesis C-methylase UbiE